MYVSEIWLMMFGEGGLDGNNLPVGGTWTHVDKSLL